MDNRVKVGVRIRPLIGLEVNNGAASAVQAHPNRAASVLVNVPARKNSYDYDWVFGPNTGQSDIYRQVCEPLVERVFEGVNATVFAYGQTGSGKTFTMGNPAAPNDDVGGGVISQAIRDIFKKRESMAQSLTGQVDIELSYIEVYMEEIYDLLATKQPNEKVKVDVRETSKGTSIDGLITRTVESAQDVNKFLCEAALNRSVGGTAMNNQSSRSHAICTFSLRITRTIQITQPSIDNKSDDTSSSNDVPCSRVEVLVSKLHLVDLAGSERAKKTQATGDTFAEGVSINKSLFALGNVVAALADGQTYIPYRDSKLTRLLQDALGGNGLTVMLACVSPADSNVEETLSTLNFAARAASIVNKASVNHDDDTSKQDVTALRKEISNLRLEIDLLRTKYSLLESSCSSNSSSSGISPTEVVVYEQDPLLVEAVDILTSSLKQLLITCLQEDTPLEDSDISAIQSNITKIYQAINQSTNELVMDSSNEFMPPIVTLIDKLSELQSLIHSTSPSHNLNADKSNCDTDNTKSQGVGNNDVGMASIRAVVTQAHIAEEGIISKQNEIAHMLDLAHKFEFTIAQLKAEIDNLEKDKQSLLSKQSTSKPSQTSSQEDLRIKKELREKSKLLEDKLKELNRKESEYSRLVSQKESLSREAEELRKGLEESVKKRCDLLRKIKEEGSSHLAEKLKLQHAEVQSKRRELQAQSELQGLKQAFTNKEKFLRSQLDSKDREIKQLKELVDKQARVKAMRGQPSSNTQAQSSATQLPNQPFGQLVANSNNNPTTELSQARIGELKLWLSQEVDSQASRVYLQEDIQKLIDSRTKLARRLADLRTKPQENNEQGNVLSKDSELTVKALEEEIRSRSVRISAKHGQLADLGSVVEKKRFGHISQDPREARVILEAMFDRLSREASLQRRSLENKVRIQSNQIDSLKRQISELTQSTNITSNINPTASNLVNKRKHVDLDESLTLDTSMSAPTNQSSNFPSLQIREQVMSEVVKTKPRLPLTQKPGLSIRRLNIGPTHPNPLQHPTKKLRVDAPNHSSASTLTKTSSFNRNNRQPVKPQLPSQAKGKLIAQGSVKVLSGGLLSKNNSSKDVLARSEKDTGLVTNVNASSAGDEVLARQVEEALFDGTNDIAGDDDEISAVMSEDVSGEISKHLDCLSDEVSEVFSEEDNEDDIDEEEEDDEEYPDYDESFHPTDDDEDEDDQAGRRTRIKKGKEALSAPPIRRQVGGWVNRPSNRLDENVDEASSFDEDQSTQPSVKLLEKCTVKELKAQLSARGLPVSGVKDVLIKRLSDALSKETRSQSNSAESSSDDLHISQNSSVIDFSIDEIYSQPPGLEGIDSLPAKHSEEVNENLPPVNAEVKDVDINANTMKKRKLYNPNTNRQMMFGATAMMLNELGDMMNNL